MKHRSATSFGFHRADGRECPQRVDTGSSTRPMMAAAKAKNQADARGRVTRPSAHCAAQSVLRASPVWPSMATRATHASRPFGPPSTESPAFNADRVRVSRCYRTKSVPVFDGLVLFGDAPHPSRSLRAAPSGVLQRLAL